MGRSRVKMTIVPEPGKIPADRYSDLNATQHALGSRLKSVLHAISSEVVKTHKNTVAEIPCSALPIGCIGSNENAPTTAKSWGP